MGDMFHKKIDKLFSGVSNVFGIADDLLIAGFDQWGENYDKILEKVLWECRQENLKLYKDKCLFRCTSIPFFGEIISQQGVCPDLRKTQALTDMPLPKGNRELQ